MSVLYIDLSFAQTVFITLKRCERGICFNRQHDPSHTMSTNSSSMFDLLPSSTHIQVAYHVSRINISLQISTFPKYKAALFLFVLRESSDL